MAEEQNAPSDEVVIQEETGEPEITPTLEVPENPIEEAAEAVQEAMLTVQLTELRSMGEAIQAINEVARELGERVSSLDALTEKVNATLAEVERLKAEAVQIVEAVQETKTEEQKPTNRWW